MDFSVLGPLRVTADGEPVYLRTGKPRVVLAMLLAHAGQTVSLDALVAATWSQPPASARRNIQQYIHQLRGVLTAGRIQSRDGGYTFVTGHDDCLDRADYESLVALARAAIDRGDTATANRLLQAAVELWRGPAFTDFTDSPAVAFEGERLTQLHLTVLERWAETELALGRHRELADTWHQVARQHPHRETMQASLMLALYRSGRQAEALDVYRQAYRRLVDDLGVEPGPDLKDLQHRILSSDPTLTHEPGSSTPQTLPPTIAVLCGRAAELAGVLGALATPASPNRAAVVALHGPGGVGKSALAVSAAHASRELFPDGQLYVDLQGATPGLATLSVGEVLARLLRALGQPPAPRPVAAEEATATLRSELAGKRVLILADNATSAEQVRLLVPEEPRCALIVTSRAALSGLDAEHIAVRPLASDAAEEMLRRLVTDDRTRQQPDEVAQVAQACSYLPLTIRIAAGRLLARPDWTVAELGRRLTDRSTALRELTRGDDRLRASFSLTWQELGSGDQTDAVARRIFLLFGGVLVRDADLDLVAAALAAGLAPTQAGLDRLVELHLLEHVAGRYRPHDVLRLFASELAARSDAEAGRHLTRVLRWYDGGSRRASALAGRPVPYRTVAGDAAVPVPELADSQAAGRWLDAERANIVAAVRQGLGHSGPLPDLSADVVLGLYPSLLMRCHGEEFELLSRAVLDAEPGRVNQRSAARVDANLGMLYRMQGRHDQALQCLNRALETLRDVGDRDGEAKTLEITAQVHVGRGDPHTAIPLFDQALRLRREAGDLVGEGTLLSNAAEAHHRLGRSDMALQMLERSLRIRRDCQDLVGESITHENIAEVHLEQRRPEQARDHADQAIAGARRCDARDVERRVLGLRARIWLSVGEHGQALADCQAALANADAARPTSPADLRELAAAFHEAGDADTAQHIHERLSQLVSAS